MKRQTLIHPRKVVWVMRDFINTIHELTYLAYTPLPAIENESVEDFWERFCAIEEKEERAKVKMISGKGFAACPNDVGAEEFRIFYNIAELWCHGSRQFAQDFCSRCPMGRGFASVTLTILHELGHLHAQQEFDGYDRAEAIHQLRKNYSSRTINFEYFKLPDEKAATDWAIEWLSSAQNRKIAKAFEKKFFACFAKKD